MRQPLLLMLGLLCLVAACSDEPTGPASTDDNIGRRTAASMNKDGDVDLKDRYIVVFRSNTTNANAKIDELTRGNGSLVHYRYQHAIKGFCATIPAQALEGIRRNPNVDFIEADARMSIISTQTLPGNGQLWGLDRLDQRALPLSLTYSYNQNGSGVTAYILDTGIRFDHQEFGNPSRATFGFDAFGGNGADGHGHGTHVSGTIGGSTVGIAKNVALKAVRVLDASGSGSTSGVIAGIDWVRNNFTPPAVANMSLGGGASPALDLAVANAVAAGVTFVVAAGNSSALACDYSPAREPSAITVGSTTNTDARSSFSNYGSCVDIFAPGSSIYSSYHSSTASYAIMSGTSMASPHTAGVAALYLGANSSATPAQVVAALTSNATIGVVGNAGTGSPNLLLFSPYGGSGNPIPTAPAAPSNLTASAQSSSSIGLSWTDNANDESGFYIERSFDGIVFSQIASVGANVTGFTNSGLTPSTTHYYRVRSWNSAGNSSYSNTAFATTLSAPVLLQVHVGAATSSTTAIRKNWQATFSVTVHNASHLPVAGATVYVSWSGGASGSGSAVTDASGVATVTTSNFNWKVGWVSMTVDNVVVTNMSYSSGANHASLPLTVYKP